MEQNYKEVRFDWYCQSCKHKDLGEDVEPCAECLTETVNLYSHKPVNYDEDKKNKKER